MGDGGDDGLGVHLIGKRAKRMTAIPFDPGGNECSRFRRRTVANHERGLENQGQLFGQPSRLRLSTRAAVRAALLSQFD